MENRGIDWFSAVALDPPKEGRPVTHFFCADLQGRARCIRAVHLRNSNVDFVAQTEVTA